MKIYRKNRRRFKKNFFFFKKFKRKGNKKSLKYKKRIFLLNDYWQRFYLINEYNKFIKVRKLMLQILEKREEFEKGTHLEKNMGLVILCILLGCQVVILIRTSLMYLELNPSVLVAINDYLKFL